MTTWHDISGLWAAVGTLFLLWTLLLTIQQITHAVALWRSPKDSSLLTSTSGQTDLTASSTGMTHWTPTEYWWSRFRHATRFTRDAALLLFLPTLLLTFYAWNSVLASKPPLPHPENESIWYVSKVLAWIVVGLIVFQVFMHLVVEPLMASRRSGGYSRLDSVMSRLEGGASWVGKWMDPWLEVAKAVLLLTLTITALQQIVSMPVGWTPR